MIKLCLVVAFLSLFYIIWSVSAIESAYREDKTAKFFCYLVLAFWTIVPEEEQIKQT